MIGKLQFWKRNRSTLFFKLLTSFMVIIVLLVSFNFLSYAFFRSNIQEEIIKNSSLNLNTAVTNYEKHLELVKTLGYNMYFSEKSEFLKNGLPNLNYELMSQIRRELQTTLTNPFLYLDNMVYLLNGSSYVIEKEGTSPADVMFDKYYASRTYNLAFWKNELTKPISFRMYPSEPFYEKGIEKAKLKGNLIPILIKNIYNQDFVIIAFLDSRKLYESLHPEGNGRFYIVDSENRVIFTTAENPEDRLPLAWNALSGIQGFLKQGTDYAFYQKGSGTGFAYVYIVPQERIASQILRLNIILFVLLAIAAVIGIGTSVFFSMKFNHPLTKIIDSIQRLNFSAAPRSNIQEFDWISEKLSDLLKTNQDIHQDLTNKNSLLSYYGYMNKLKMIHQGNHEIKMPLDANKPFLLVLFRITFKRAFSEESDFEQHRAVYFMREYIQAQLTQCAGESLTFQLEKDQILSLIFADQLNRSDLLDHLNSLKQVFDFDNKYLLVTIAVSALQHDSESFAETYEHVMKLTRQRRLIDETQIIADDSPLPAPVLLSPSDEQEFHANLSAGNDAVPIQIVRRLLAGMSKRQAAAVQFDELARDIVQRGMKALGAAGADYGEPPGSTSPYELAADCHSAEQYQSFFEQFLTSAANRIKQKKSATDHITQFVTDYVENHYAEDISLDLIADKLNITPAYLSSYFKEKKGINFSEYIHAFRMNKAKELLEHADLKIQDVAQRVGYHNVNSFIRVFKKHTGLPPGEFRKGAHIPE